MSPRVKAGNNIYLNGRFLSQKVTGVQRYALELVKALDLLLASGAVASPAPRFTLLVPPQAGELPGLSRIRVRRVGHLKGHLWEQLELPWHVRDGLLISLCNTAPLFLPNQVVTFHDAAVFSFPQAYSLLFRSWYRIIMRRVGRIAQAVLTVSRFSQGELVAKVGIPADKIEVLPNAIDHMHQVEPDHRVQAQFSLQQGGYALAVSSMNPTKNFPAIVAAFQLLDDPTLELVIAGGKNSRIFSELEMTLPDRVKFVGYVDDRQLKSLYQHAAFFVFPSLYEGFGLPPLEAMACGCPVVAAKAASLPEVCQDAALYCDPLSVADLAAQMGTMYRDRSLREGFRERGVQLSRRYTWRSRAEQLLAVLGLPASRPSDG